MRDAGTTITFAGPPYAHLHICGDPWEGDEYQPDVDAVWTMTYRRSARGEARAIDDHTCTRVATLPAHAKELGARLVAAARKHGSVVVAN